MGHESPLPHLHVFSLGLQCLTPRPGSQPFSPQWRRFISSLSLTALLLPSFLFSCLDSCPVASKLDHRNSFLTGVLTSGHVHCCQSKCSRTQMSSFSCLNSSMFPRCLQDKVHTLSHGIQGHAQQPATHHGDLSSAPSTPATVPSFFVDVAFSG